VQILIEGIHSLNPTLLDSATISLVAKELVPSEREAKFLLQVAPDDLQRLSKIGIYSKEREKRTTRKDDFNMIQRPTCLNY
jgi:hypothetical protein